MFFMYPIDIKYPIKNDPIIFIVSVEQKLYKKKDFVIEPKEYLNKAPAAPPEATKNK